MSTIKNIILGTVAAAISYLSISSYKEIQHKKEIEKNIQMLPRFAFQQQQGGLFTDAAIDPAKKTLINYFNPGCEHCQYMAAQIQKNKAKFTPYQLLFVTLADSTAIDGFQKKYGLYDQPNITFLRDTRFEFEKVFGAGILPSFFIYVQHKKLIKKISGETKIEKLLN